MVDTRSSTRKSCTPKGVTATTPAVGSKRTGSTASFPKPKRSKKGDEKVQVTIEEALSKESAGDSSKDDVEIKDDRSHFKDDGNPSLAESRTKNGAKVMVEVSKEEEMITEKNNDETRDEVNGNSHIKHGANGLTGCANGFAENYAQKIEGLNGESDESTKAGEAATMQIRKPSDAVKVNKIEPQIDMISCKPDAKDDERSDGNTDSAVTKEAAIEESSRREDSTPSSILEKGIIYFFFRGRVNMDEPSNVGDIARSYIVLRPIAHGAKIGNGPIEDAGINRLLALPKKVLPNTSKDRFMVFVEKANASLEEIKSSLGASDYLKKTAGARHTPSATPVGEGVYAIIKAGRESHLAYILTIPSELGEVQKDIGLRHRGSFVTTAKNPQYPGPQNTRLSESPTYPRE